MFKEKAKTRTTKCQQLYDDEIWMGMFEKFVAYKNQHKNTIVPRRYDEDPKLGWWVSSQRKAYKNDMLLPNQSICPFEFSWIQMGGRLIKGTL